MNKSEATRLARKLRQNQTPAEEFLWDKVRNRRLGGFKFTRQFPIEYTNNSYYVADFHCHEKKVIIELDGPIHEKQQAYDESRDGIMSGLGFKTMRFKNEELINNWDRIRKEIIIVLTLP